MTDLSGQNENAGHFLQPAVIAIGHNVIAILLHDSMVRGAIVHTLKSSPQVGLVTKLLALGPDSSTDSPRVGRPVVVLEQRIDGSTVGHTQPDAKNVPPLFGI